MQPRPSRRPTPSIDRGALGFVRKWRGPQRAAPGPRLNPREFAPVEFVRSHPFAKCAKGWGRTSGVRAIPPFRKVRERMGPYQRSSCDPTLSQSARKDGARGGPLQAAKVVANFSRAEPGQNRSWFQVFRLRIAEARLMGSRSFLKFFKASRILVLMVPSGEPVLSAISEWVIPPK